MELAEDLARKLFFDVILKAVISKVITAVPFLGAFPFSLILTPIVMWLGGKIFDVMKESGYNIYIDFKTEAEKNEYLKEVENLKKVIESNPTPEEKEKAKNEFKKKLADLIHTAPSA